MKEVDKLIGKYEKEYKRKNTLECKLIEKTLLEKFKVFPVLVIDWIFFQDFNDCVLYSFEL